MDLHRWLSLYDVIRGEFGFPKNRDEAAAALLDMLLAGKRDGFEELSSLVRGNTVYVVAPGPGARGGIEELRPALENSVTVAADAALNIMLESGLEPHAVFTDLDGAGPLLKRFRGLQVIHAHGDNMDLLCSLVPRIEAPTVGTVQVYPRGRTRVLGGFTDGDRAVSAACWLGARRVALVGWDLGAQEYFKPGRMVNMLAKAKKLSWARRILGFLASEGCRIEGQASTTDIY